MKEFDELIAALNEKNVIKNIQKTTNVVPLPPGLDDKESQEWVDDAVRGCLMTSFHKYEELEDKFARYCFEVGMQQLMKELAIKPDPNYEASADDKLLALLLNKIFD